MLNLDKETKRKIMNPRGRPKANKSIAMYHSQIKDNNVGIKLCIKKSAATATVVTATESNATKVPKTKQPRKRKSKNKTQNSDSEGETEVFEKKRRKDTKNKSNNNEQEDGVKQGPYGDRLPEHVLHKVRFLRSPIQVKLLLELPHNDQTLSSRSGPLIMLGLPHRTRTPDRSDFWLRYPIRLIYPLGFDITSDIDLPRVSNCSRYFKPSTCSSRLNPPMKEAWSP